MHVTIVTAEFRDSLEVPFRFIPLQLLDEQFAPFVVGLTQSVQGDRVPGHQVQ